MHDPTPSFEVPRAAMLRRLRSCWWVVSFPHAPWLVSSPHVILRALTRPVPLNMGPLPPPFQPAPAGIRSADRKGGAPPFSSTRLLSSPTHPLIHSFSFAFQAIQLLDSLSLKTYLNQHLFHTSRNAFHRTLRRRHPRGFGHGSAHSAADLQGGRLCRQRLP